MLLVSRRAKARGGARIVPYLLDGRAEFARMRDEARRKHPALYSKLEAARHGAPSPPYMRPRFQADADFNQKIVLGLLRRERAVDLVDAHAAVVIGISDPESFTKRPIWGGFCFLVTARACRHTLRDSSAAAQVQG